MSLQIWLPLNGDLTQQGLSNVTVTNNGATVDNNGKIGKCYSFNGDTSAIDLTYSDFPNIFSGDFTVSMWIYNNDSGGRSIFFGNYSSGVGTFGFNIEKQTNEAIRFYWSGSPDYYANDTVITASAWTHLTIVKTSSNVKFYTNGVLTNTYTGTLSNVSSTGITYFKLGRDGRSGSTCFKGKLNDFRIYNHALSAKEVKALSQGLVCHYPLNNAGNGQKNYLKNSNFLQGTNGMEGYIANGSTCTKQSDCMKIVSTSSSYGIFTSNFDAITTGDMTTFSAWVKADSSMTIYIGTDGSGNGSCQAYTVGTNWQKISISKEKTTNNANLRIYGNGTFYVRQMKYELGSKATGWCPNPADTAYTSMGYNSTTEYDVSGYKYNGTKTGTFAYDVDTARYSVSTKFNGTNTYIEADPLPAETKTISVWLKTTWAYPPSGYRLAVHDKNTGLAIGWTTAMLIASCGTTNGSTCVPTGKYIANQWNHVVIVKTGATTRDIYINGEKMTTAVNDYWAGDQNTLNIGNRHYRGVYSAYWDGQMSDFRAYATALSADDILELYNTVASVANNGTLLTRGEIVEQ